MKKIGRKFVVVEKEHFKRKGIEISFQRYAIDVLGLMAMGLFASLLIGLY